MSVPLIETIGLKKYFKTSRGMLHAVDGVDLSIAEGETLGVVGESGCGKSTLGRTILRLLPLTDGKILYRGTDITGYGTKELKRMRKEMQIIFQDPYSSLNPRMTVSEIIAEPLEINGLYTGRGERQNYVERLMDTVGLAQRLINTYPHELDGGRRQRIGIARALSVSPSFIVCDEPVSALDVSIQAQILNLMMDLQEEMKLTYMFITHDLSVVKHISNNIAVMYLGQCVELGSSDMLFEDPLHPYTQALIRSIPVPTLEERTRRHITLKGELSNPIDPAPGCRFAPRCPNAAEGCLETIKLREVKPGHFVACHLS